MDTTHIKALISTDGIKQVIAAFTNANRDLYLVGGCIRDLALGQTPKDLDLTTPATPDEIAALLEPLGKLWEAGRAYGTIGVSIGGDIIEVTTFRTETYTEISRNPDVSYTTSLEADLARRDLTFNALACQVAPHISDIIDPYNGLEHLANKVLTTPGEANDRISEDPLRIIRAIRFAARYEATLDDDLEIACRNHADRLEIITAERIEAERTKIFNGHDRNIAHGLRIAQATGTLDALLGTTGATLRTDIPASLTLTAHLTTLTKEQRQQWAKDNAISNTEAKHHEARARTIDPDATDATLRYLAKAWGPDVVHDILLLSGNTNAEQRLERANARRFATWELPVNGNDYLTAGLTGKAIGRSLTAAAEHHAANPAATRDDLLEATLPA